ncbi:hypothetical protein BLS_009839 [Venturia inaequalis]|uniref:Uncharacterized protein n=1 Tax=Venturia inaequalis TaxID=5025 RepID=A0A8H3Z169_VENIN|nr:hypothetical protein BLS_009839 [Venturia inaequalis]
MFVLEGAGEDPWATTFTYKSQLNTFDQFAIDGTYFQHKTGLYHVYSCWFSEYMSWPANLCITKMENPYTVSSTLSERKIISSPTNAWEKTPYNRTINDRLSSNEGPQQLNNPSTGQQFIIYSAARSDNRNYCLGQLELVGNDPMDLASWKKTNDGCVFYQNPQEEAFGVGHASFVKSPDGSEDWIVYHGMRDPTNGWSARTIRAQKFGWNNNGSPKFPRPGYGPYTVPSGHISFVALLIYASIIYHRARKASRSGTYAPASTTGAHDSEYHGAAGGLSGAAPYTTRAAPSSVHSNQNPFASPYDPSLHNLSAQPSMEMGRTTSPAQLDRAAQAPEVVGADNGYYNAPAPQSGAAELPTYDSPKTTRNS